MAGAELITAGGSVSGSAALRSLGDRLELTVHVNDMPPGPHGAHLHTVGACTAPDFASAGPHLNPHARMHGSGNPQGSHLGDLPNLIVDGNGDGALVFTLPGSAAELERQLFDADGTAIVIHATADDYRTDPSGNSGARIACGVLKARAGPDRHRS